MKSVMPGLIRMHQHVLPIVFIGLLLAFSLFSPLPARAQRAVMDCEGTIKAWVLGGYYRSGDCSCATGKPVCNKSSGSSSGTSKKSHSSSKSSSSSMKNNVKLQLFQGILDGAMQGPKKNVPSQQQKDAQQEAQQQLQMQREQKERELEFERQKNFAEEKDRLIGNLKGSSMGMLGLKTPSYKDTQAPLPVDAAVLREQDEFDNMNAAWMKKQIKLIDQRCKEPNKYASDIYKSLKTNAPPPPWKTFDELQSGDVLLIEGETIAYLDNKLSGGNNASSASHTVIYLKEVNGKKLFLDNQPFGNAGPRIISEDEFMKLYGSREAKVAKLAQPLNEKEGKKLFSAAVEMAQKNRIEVSNNWFGSPLLGTNYGAWGKENVVCSESDWALINATGRNIPKSGDRTKVALGIDFSPADYVNSPYFLVTPFW